jgi:hypothetical protein
MSLVDQHPLVQAVDAKLADLQKRRSEFEARVAKIAEADGKAQQAYDYALDDALLRGGPMPPPLVRQLPELADVEVRHRFMNEQAQLTEERRKAVAAAYPDVLRQARSQAKKLAAAARKPYEELLATMDEIGDLLTAGKTCRDAQNDSNSHRHYNDSPLTLHEFIRIVASAADPIDAVVDLGGRRVIRALDVIGQRV